MIMAISLNKQVIECSSKKIRSIREIIPEKWGLIGKGPLFNSDDRRGSCILVMKSTGWNIKVKKIRLARWGMKK